MTTQIVPPSPTQPISQNDIMKQQFRTWTQGVTKALALIGSGSPESVVEADVSQLYVDTGGTSGSVLYVKRDDNIGGNRKQGWILV